ncbi:PREDICTED: cytochrome P450 9e2-like [Dinoponera quadriceps]|uniref:Cytochrome P450 9e2-like n=1 Tax=Dinoponera quadriceps TaxID=609295 RepID=A0A6P3XD33_DINQU|nr:PREDICTED: cytochrome P450 9e2-like [Dinoponera quadriceps]
MAIVFWTLVAGMFVALYIFLTRNFKYWQKRGVPCASGALPGVGHMLSVVCFKISYADRFRQMYKENKNSSMVGFYNFSSPALMVIEPELVKTVLQTNFASFQENAIHIDPDLNPLVANNPFLTTGEKWMSGRKRLTYAFSSMRLKVLLESVKSVCVIFESFVDRKLDKMERAEFELQDLFSRYTAQVVASAGFGVDGHCFDKEESSASFRNIAKKVLEPSTRNAILFTIITLFPGLNRIFRMSFIPKEVDRFFRKLVSDVMQKRRTEDISRNDFLQLMVELERMEGDKFDIGVLASHATSFIIDGYDTSSRALSFIGFQLATHPEVQQKLRKEVVSVLSKYDGVLTYEALKEMTYMDQVINESQRIMPMGEVLFKLCTAKCELKGSDGLVCSVEPGMTIMVPVIALQEDPRYWDKPEIFDPERFSPDRKHNIERFTFLPFGEGPRICVGMRMALLQMKACLAVLLKKYSLELSPRTQIPLKMIPGTFLPTPEGGLWVFIRQL